MDWRADLEAVLLPVRGETVLYMYRVHPLRASPFSFHMWKRLVCCVGSRAFPVPGYFGTWISTQPAQDSLVFLVLLGLSVHRQARARRCRDMYRHIRAPENPSMRGGGQRQRKSLLRNGEARRLILKAGQAQGSARQGWRRQV